MDLISIFFLIFWTLFGNWSAGADPWPGCDQDNDLQLKIRACTQIAQGSDAKEAALALTYRGLAYGYLGDGDRANADFAQAIADMTLMIQRNSLDSAGFWIRGIAHRGRNNQRQALADYDEAIRLDPQNTGAFNSRCWARALWGIELHLARADCDKAVELSGNWADAALDSRGMVLMKQGRLKEAWDDYDAALRLTPNYVSALYGRGIAALRLGRTEEGSADLRAALRINPDIAKMYASFGMTP